MSQGVCKAVFVEVKNPNVIFFHIPRIGSVVEVHGATIEFSLVFVHDKADHRALGPVATVHVLNKVTVGPYAHAHQDLVQVCTLVHPASVFGEGIQLVIGDQVGLQVLLPVSDALQSVIGVAVDVDGSAKVISGPAIGFIDGDLLLVSVTNGQP